VLTLSQTSGFFGRHRAHEAAEAIERRQADGLLRLRHDRDVLDLERDAPRAQAATGGRSIAAQHDVERAIDERIEQILIELLEHRAEREQLLFVALFDLRAVTGCVPRCPSE
jgi:hypothetical protein